MSKWWSGKSKGNPLGYKIFVWCLDVFGLRFTYLILAMVVSYFWVFAPKVFISQYRYFNQRLHKNPFSSVFWVFRNYFSFGQVILDKIAMLSGRGGKLKFEFDGEEHLQTMVNNGKGGILLGAHIGNWAVAGQLLKRINVKVNVVMLDGEVEKIQSVINQQTIEQPFNIIPLKDDLSHVIMIKEALRNNEFVCIHGDRSLSESNTAEVLFMDATAHFPLGPHILAGKFNAPVSFVFAMKSTLSTYHFYASAPQSFKLPRQADAKNNVLMLSLNRYVSALESTLLKYPHQWYNYYNFWNR
ncbi:lipid A biosynthesis acyltransferase [Persicobacter psychrovividus]|uniref:Lipid A biosynthesis acyltransferase n=1 Tax=Persicobacter psychrovividus TaxID=387638 RepID=A0ABM7VMA3_9BACT|nr:lipid A biosynthesis acyltransferase [Persicobacter psychrovividus]